MRVRLSHTALVCLGLASTLTLGCAQERAPINRVQAAALEKSFFVGANLEDPSDDPEFRMKVFNVGGTVGQSAYSVGEYSALDRIRWEITEKLLIGRKAYEVSPGADNRGTPENEWSSKANDKTLVKSPNGAIVAAYPILSHFDIRRTYNPTTGEELNVVEENTSDREWFDRQFMRVDWSTNVVDGPNDPTKFFSESLGAPATPLAYSITDPNSDDAPHIDTSDGYFDITNKFTVDPDTMQFSWGSIKTCQLYGLLTGSSTYDCNPQEAIVRLSFAKVQPSEDFEPFEDTFAWHDIVGNMGGDGDSAQTSFGSAPRQGWDPQYGYTDALTKRFKNIHEIFAASHQAVTCDSNVDGDGNGSADQCENATTGYGGSSGSRCDVNVGKCTIPVRDRQVKTVGYWFNREAPEELQDALDGQGNVATRGTLEELTYSWNQLLEVSLAYRREVECRATGDGDRDSCHALYFDGTGPDSQVMVGFGNWLIDRVKPQAVDGGRAILTACHNPVRSYDALETCGEVGSKARLGDQRKNFLVYWPFDSRAHYGGVAGVTPDPVTGEIRGASATIMGRSATYAAAAQRDIIQLALGDLKIDELIQGVAAQRYVNTVQSGALAAPGLIKGLSSEELQHRAASLDLARLRGTATSATLAATGIDRVRNEMLTSANTTEDVNSIAAGVGTFDALAQKLRTKMPELEAQVVDGKFLQSALGVAPSTSVTQDLLAAASPLQGLDPARNNVVMSTYLAANGGRGACFDDATASNPGSVYLASLAGYFKAKYGDLDPIERGKRIYDDLWKESVKGIGIHELGHSLGLRHNFASSWDAPNYSPQYWQLRSDEGKSTGACSSPRSGDQDSCMGPRYVDPLTSDEQGLASESRPSIDYFANSSVMEYQIERFGETVGLGTYDLHAMKTLYGRVLETIDDRVVPLADQQKLAGRNFSQLVERDIISPAAPFYGHYTSTARALKVFDPTRDCRAATDDEKAHGLWRIVHGQVCSPSPRDHWNFDEFKTETIPSFGVSGVKWHVVDRDGKDRVRWQYRYGEEYGDGGHLHTQAGDAGGDVYELVQNLKRRFEITYPWTYFRRQNREYLTMNLPQAIASQYFARARGYHWNVAISMGRSSDAELASDDVLRPYAMAEADLLGLLQNAILQPEPGNYTPSADRTVGPSALPIFDLSQTGGRAFTVGIGDGRYIGEEFDEVLGGSWDYQQYVKHAGFEVEKSLAMMQLVDPRPTLFTIARENFLDERNVYVNFRNDLPDAVDSLVAGVLAEDWGTVAPAVNDTTTGEVVPVDLTRDVVRTSDSKVVFPNIGYKQQLAIAMYAGIFSRLGSDMTLVDKMRVWVDGDRAPNVPASRVASFVDPRTGYTYQAARFDAPAHGAVPANSAGTVDRGIASRMLSHANQLTLSAYRVELDANGAPVLDAAGKPTLVLDTQGQPIVADATRENELRMYIGLLDSVRQIALTLGDGPLSGGD